MSSGLGTGFMSVALSCAILYFGYLHSSKWELASGVAIICLPNTAQWIHEYWESTATRPGRELEHPHVARENEAKLPTPRYAADELCFHNILFPPLLALFFTRTWAAIFVFVWTMTVYCTLDRDWHTFSTPLVLAYFFTQFWDSNIRFLWLFTAYNTIDTACCARGSEAFLRTAVSSGTGALIYLYTLLSSSAPDVRLAASAAALVFLPWVAYAATQTPPQHQEGAETGSTGKKNT